MPRIARSNITSKYIHIVAQGIAKEYIFKNYKYKDEYIKIINKIVDDFENIKIIAFCIMDNHVHLLVYIDKIQYLSKMMSRINTSYAIYYNKILNREGYVFKNRYYTQEIMDEKHLFNTLSYIHKNPVKAKMVENEIDYMYSSYKDYVKGNIKKEIVDLLFNSQDYLNEFYSIHRNSIEENILDIKEEKIILEEKFKDIITNFSIKYNCDIDYIKKDRYLFTLLIKEIKDNCNISNKYVSDYFRIGKNRISAIIKNY
ncbi:MAG: hypothetical protein HFJ60_05525 [Clostridia bacterium]|jgi:putative transposase|nr:hypothetical protein [Clostridia bacterium]